MRDYVICVPKLSGSNGVRVLHILAKELKKRGFTVYLFSVPSEENFEYDYITEITEDMRQNAIVVYPEMIYGNPLKFKNVVRWILYYPNEYIESLVNNGYELPFVFERDFYSKGDILKISGLDRSIFYKDEKVEKNTDCYFVYKGGEWKDIPEFKSMIKITRQYPKTREELGNLLRRTKTLYSFDDCSFILEEALECGCDVKIVRPDGFEDYKSNLSEVFKDSENQIENFIQKTQNYNYSGEIAKCDYRKIKLKNLISYFKYKFAHKVFHPFNKEIAQKCWFRAETKISNSLRKEKMFNYNIYKGKKVFITGHTGFKGSWLSVWLTLLGAEVCGYSLEPNTQPAMFNELGLKNRISKSVIGNILDKEFLETTMNEFCPDIVFHLAAQPLVRLSYSEPLLTYETNVIGSLNVLEAARKCKSVKAFVNITTDKCYENKETLRGYKETDPMGGYDMYSSSKGCVEIMTSSYRRSFLEHDGYALATVRAGNVIGGGDWAEDRLIPDCIRSINQGADIQIRNPNAVRPWQHVLEPLSGYLLVGQKLLTDGKKFAEGYNFGPENDSISTVEDVAKNICEAYGKGKVHVGEKSSLHEANLLTLNIDKAKKVLGWKPKYDAQIAIKETVDWYKHFYDKDCDIYEFTLEQIKKYEEK